MKGSNPLYPAFTQFIFHYVEWPVLFLPAMKPNIRKPLLIKNNSKYFNPSKDKVFVEVQSPDTYKSRKAKIEGYEARLYWQFKKCESVGGQTFFYTLTYNDSSIPKHYGVNCFDYEDLRDLLTGGFRKMLLRKYGTKFKYFIGAELGDGAGCRGLHNNPHYHILFFLQSAEDSRFPYKVISSLEFRHLVRMYWQGYDQDNGYVSYKSFKYGIAKEGENLGLVSDYRACIYCAKYVCKDVKLKAKEIDLRRLLLMRFRSDLKNSIDFHKDFINEIVIPLYSIPIGKGCFVYKFEASSLFAKFLPEAKFFEALPNENVLNFYGNDETFIFDTKRLCKAENLWKYYYDFLNERLTILVDDAISEWRNRFSNKCRISHGVGDFALEFIRDYTKPYIEVPSKKGFIHRPLNLYYYRKLFTGFVRPIERTFNGKFVEYEPLRVLNKYGIEYKVAHLQERIDKTSSEAFAYVSLVIDNEELYNQIRSSDVNISVFWSYLEFIDKFKGFKLGDFDIFKKYAEFKLVYEGRYIEVTGDFTFPNIDILADYRSFIVPSCFDFYRSDLTLDELINNNFNGYVSYENHPYFLDYVGYFHLLDLLKDYFFCQTDKFSQQDAEKYAEIRRFHKKLQFINYQNSI